jgi:penicillin-binding protein 1C
MHFAIMPTVLRPSLKAVAHWIQRWQNWLVGVALVFSVLVGCRLWPHPPLRGWFPSSTAVYDDKGKLLRLTLSSDQQYRLWVPLKDISPQLVQGVLLHEDRWYAWHPGFNPYGLLRGAWITYVRHGAPQGGSTITMQLARLLWGLNTRTPLGKLRQLGRAVQLELFYSKQQILEAYLNDAPYGANVQGVGTASLVYFGKPASQLTLPEALTLVVIPQNPSRRLQAGQSTTNDAQISRGVADARNRLYDAWVRKFPHDASMRPLFVLPLTLRPLNGLPFEAPHAVEQALASQQTSDDRTNPVLKTTIDLDLQRSMQRQIALYVQRNASRGINNASAILVDTRDMGIKAMVGSADYHDASIQGQVNGTLAKRSPGSTLKPFIYALGFDQGILQPQTVLRDVPTAFGPYTPENFDGNFLGPITATQALIRSRNIPAVWVASQLHQPSLYDFLQQSGISRLASEQHYGLSLVLGGGEVSMQELAGLYAMLANQGVLRPLRLRANEPQVQGTRMLSEEATYMVMDILRQNPRPDDAVSMQSMRMPIYWKTGTSWAFRDAWTAGSFGPYVLVVWVGNFDGSGNPAFVGVDTAAPLFFQIIDALHAEHVPLDEPIRHMPANLKRVQICLASGNLPTEWCPQKGMTWFIPGKSPIKVDEIYRPLVIDDATGTLACPPYDGKHTHIEVYEFWPSDLQHVFQQAGMPRRSPPTNPSCNTGERIDGTVPSITSPLRGSTYTLRLKQLDEERIPFTATSDADAHALYWFVDDAYVGRSSPNELMYWQPHSAGRYTIRVVDDHGRADQRLLDVNLVD